MTFYKSFLISLIVLLILGLTFMAGYILHDQLSSAKNFPVLNESYQILTTHGLNEIPTPPALEYGMIRGMLQSYDDPFTVFVEPAQQELQTDSLQGSFGGIGVRIEKDDRGKWRIYPFPDGPAAQAGIQQAAYLLAIDQLQLNSDTNLDKIQAALRGPVGSKVSISISEVSSLVPAIFTLRRAEIQLPSVTWRSPPDNRRIGILEVNLIASNTAKELERGFLELQNSGAKEFILDLRNNPGGLLESAIEISRLFLKDGVIMQQQYRGKEIETFRVDHPGKLSDIPLIVLINQNSASAAEIIAGALQAHHRAKLVGTPSFGKNTIQLVFDLPGGAALHVTSAKWWIPGNDLPQNGQGLQPDVLINKESDNGSDPVLKSAVQMFANK
jgi:carboxyl-terminal processing protease